MSMRACLIFLAALGLAACTPETDEAAGSAGTAEAGLAVCGGMQGLACGAGEYCFFPQTGFCGAADQTGVCMPRPESCVAIEYNPVCGCNDLTYTTGCAAAAAGTSVAYPGECQP